MQNTDNIIHIINGVSIANHEGIQSLPIEQLFDCIVIINNSVQVKSDDDDSTKIQFIDFNMNDHKLDYICKIIINVLQNNKKILICDVTMHNPLVIMIYFLSKYLTKSYGYAIYWLMPKIKNFMTEELLFETSNFFNYTT